MPRLRRMACCWLIGSATWIALGFASLRAQDGSVPASSVIRLKPLPGEVEPPVVTALAAAMQGPWIAVAGDDHAIRLIDPATGESVETRVEHRDWVRGLSFSPSGSLLASCGHDGEICVWDLAGREEGVRLLSRQRAEHALFALAFADETTLFAVGFGNAVYRLNLATADLQVDHRCECKDLRAIDVSRDGRSLAYGGRDGIIRVRPLDPAEYALASAPASEPAPAIRLSARLHGERIVSIRFADDSQTIYSCGEDRRLVKWDPTSDRVLATMDLRAGKLMAVCPLDQNWVAVAGSDNTVRIVDIERSLLIAKLVGHDGSVAAIGRDATHLFSSGFDTTVRTWNIQHAMERLDPSGRFVHPISAQFEDSSSEEPIR